MKARRHGLIVTADDFGLHPAVNEAVEIAHLNGVLTAASLMIGAAAAADAVERARRLPTLRVGLHLVLADGAPSLSPQQVPDLVDEQGRFGSAMACDGVRFFFLPQVRRQLAAEIRAQFEAFAATGLRLDHVNAHKHFHLHPTVLSLILKIGKDYGLRAIRLPLERKAPLWLQPWLHLMQRRLQAAGIDYNDHIFGITQSGRMNETALLEAIAQMPDGLNEIYLHPAMRAGGEIAPTMHGYRHDEELAALLSPRVRKLLEDQGIARGGFADFG